MCFESILECGGKSMVAVSKTWLLSKLGFKPVVMYFIKSYAT